LRTRPRASILASPALVGAITVLILGVAVVLAVNANQGLPFVPTYDVKAELPGGLNLVVGNEVRVGGAHVGVVDKIDPSVDSKSGRTIAVVHMKLDRELDPLPKTTQVRIRPRSVLGLKYVELGIPDGVKPDKGDELAVKNGETLPLKQATDRPYVEIDQFFSTNTKAHRENTQRVLEGGGNVFTGRGEAINRAIRDFVPFFVHLEPVMTTLSDPGTQLNRLFRQLSRFNAQLAPVAATYADLFGNMATTFEALGRDETRLRETIERSPRTLEEGIESLPVQRGFLEDSERLYAELAPTARQLQRSLPGIADALDTGRPVLRRSPTLFSNTRNVFGALRDLVRNPDTLLALKDLTTLVQLAAPLVEYVAPYQTVCNYWVYYWTSISEHVSEPVRNGTIQRALSKTDNRTQDNRVSIMEAEVPADIPEDQSARTATDPEGNPLTTLHRQYYQPAIDAQGNADCQEGQKGYLEGPLVEGGRYPRGQLGGNHVVVDPDTPGNRGPTFKGVPRLQDVP
jgi:virulence factor Mce-like protein